MIVSLSEEQIKNAVRERYSRLAVLNQTCCGNDTENVCCGSAITEEADLPSEALSVVASCGSPLPMCRFVKERPYWTWVAVEALTFFEHQNW